MKNKPMLQLTTVSSVDVYFFNETNKHIYNDIDRMFIDKLIELSILYNLSTGEFQLGNLISINSYLFIFI